MNGSKSNFTKLLLKADNLRKNNDLEESIQTYLEALEFAVEPEQDWEVRINLAEVYSILSQFNKGNEFLNPLLNKDLPIDLKIRQLALCYYNEQANLNYEKAHELITEAYNLAIDNYGANSILASNSIIIYSRSLCYKKEPEHKTALKLLHEQLALYESLNDKTHLIKCYYYLILANFYSGQFEEMEKYFQKSVADYKIIKDHKHMGLIHSLYFFVASNKSVKLGLKVLDDSANCFKKAYKSKWKSNYNYGLVCYKRGVLECKRKDYSESIYYLREAHLLGIEIDALFLKAAPCVYFVEAYEHLGMYDKALKYANLGYDLIKVKGEETFAMVNFLLPMGLIYCHFDKSKAIAYWKRGLEILEILGIDKATTGYRIIYQHLSLNCEGAEGLKYANLLLEASQGSIDQPIAQAEIYRILGLKHLRNQSNQAISNFKKALVFLLNEPNLLEGSFLDWKDNLLSHSAAWGPIAGMAQAYFNRYETSNDDKDLEQSYYWFDSALELLDYLNNIYKAERTKLQLNEEFIHILDLGLKVNTLLAPVDCLSKSFQFIETGKAKILQSAFTEGRAKTLLKGSPYLLKEQALKEEVLALRIQIEKMKLKDSKEDRALFNDFIDKRKSYHLLIDEIEDAYPAYKRSKYQNAILPIKEIQASLENKSLLNYFLVEDGLYIQYISEFETELIKVSVSENFPGLVKAFIKSIRHLENENYLNYAFQLYQILIQPVADLIFGMFHSDEIIDLIIIPHASLSLLPFEALLNSPFVKGEQPDYLLNHANISYHYSASLWCLQKQKSAERKSGNGFLGMAPVYEHIEEEAELQSNEPFQYRTDESLKNKNKNENKIENEEENENENEKEKWTHLPFSKVEITEIAKLFNEKESQFFVSETASKENFLRYAGQAEIIHLAAHFQQHEVPKLSGLVFANNEKLYIQETFNLKLAAKLVVLSACESGIGELYGSEGMMTINRGLLYSGVQNIISTLFVVYDKNSYQLMRLFYQYLLQGESICLALSKAKRKIMEEKPMISPIHWCPFVLVGE